MAVKSIISIDVQDGAFRAFQTLYAKYDKALKSAPGAWALVNKNIDGSRASFDKLVGQMAAANVQAQLRAKAQERADQLTRSSAERWTTMARSTREFARNIGDATMSLLKWGSITGVISGLVGAGGLWGIDRMAIGVAGSRRSALGLGLGIGEQSAFSNFGRLVDPDAFLQSVSSARFDVEKNVGLRAAGVPQGGNTAQTAVALLDRLKKIADTTNPRLFAQTLKAFQLDQFANSNDLERLRNTSPEEYARLKGQFGERAKQFDLDPDTARRWQDFVTQMDNAGKTIQTVLIKGLVGLADPLSNLSKGVESVARTLLEKGGPLERWINQAGEGLQRFATYIGKPEFQEDVRKFVEGMGELAETVASWVKWAVPKAKTVANVASGAATIGGIASDLVHGNIDLMGTGGTSAGKGRLIGNTTGMNPELVKRLQAMAAGEGNIYLNSGFRTAEQQEALRHNIFAKYPVAKGTSMHELGLAADIRGGAPGIDNAIHRYAAKYGLKFPVPGDPVHAQMIDDDKKKNWHSHTRHFTTSGRTVITVEHDVGDQTPMSVNGLPQQ